MSFLVVAEHRNGRVEDTTLEAFARGRALSDASGAQLKAALLGADLSSLASELATYPVDEVLVVQDKRLQQYSPEGYSAALRLLLEGEKCSVVLAGHTATGYEYLPRVAGDLRKPLVTDAVELQVEDSTLLVTRMGYNGKVAVELAVENPDPCFVTLRPGVSKAPPRAERSATVREVDLDLSSLETHRSVLGYEKPVSEDIDISEADVIVAAGRGIKEKENLTIIEDLAEVLGGVVAGSRPLIDKDWLPWSRQVGSSGKTVRPRLYIACGISGAMQHVTGMKSSKTIVAVNVDPTAPIFGVAHYGVVGDLFKVIPELIKELGRG